VELLRLERVEIGYRRPLLPPLDLTVRRGQRLAVLGPNGSGKSTLLKSLLGLIPLLSGARQLPLGRLPRMGYVPQAHRSDPVYPLTTLEVVLMGRYGRLGLGRFPSRSDRTFAEEKLDRVGLSAQRDAQYRSLSGGQRQRALLARALCGEPELLVLDEFTSDLDPAASSALLAEVSRLAQALDVAAVFVTHEVAAAAAHSTDVAMLDARHGFFETGPRATLLSSERLSKLYGQRVHVEEREGRTVVFVEAGS
jgi:ABC-type Mn2+/Zn2+ transport system ATPase subunit